MARFGIGAGVWLSAACRGLLFLFLHYPTPGPCCCGYGTYMLKSLRGLGEVMAMPRAGTICCEPGCPKPAVYRGRCRSHAQDCERHQRATVATKRDEPSSREARRQTIAARRTRRGTSPPSTRMPSPTAATPASPWRCCAAAATAGTAPTGSPPAAAAADPRGTPPVAGLLLAVTEVARWCEGFKNRFWPAIF